MNRIYQEEDSSSFTHNGKEYKLNPILKKAHTLPVQELKTEELEWLINDTVVEDEERVLKADYNFPILITRYGNKWVTIDGYHRFLKARKDGKKILKVKKIPTSWLTKQTDSVLTIFTK